MQKKFIKYSKQIARPREDCKKDINIGLLSDIFLFVIQRNYIKSSDKKNKICEHMWV